MRDLKKEAVKERIDRGYPEVDKRAFLSMGLLRRPSGHLCDSVPRQFADSLC